MLGEKRIRRKVGEAVQRAIEPGEELRASVYLHTYSSLLPVIATGGVQSNIHTTIVALTDRRVLVLAGNEMNAAKSQLIAAFPRAEVAVDAGDRPTKPTHLELTLGGVGSHRFAVPLIWRGDAAAFVADLAGQ